MPRHRDQNYLYDRRRCTYMRRAENRVTLGLRNSMASARPNGRTNERTINQSISAAAETNRENSATSEFVIDVQCARLFAHGVIILGKIREPSQHACVIEL